MSPQLFGWVLLQVGQRERLVDLSLWLWILLLCLALYFLNLLNLLNLLNRLSLLSFLDHFSLRLLLRLKSLQ